MKLLLNSNKDEMYLLQYNGGESKNTVLFYILIAGVSAF